jgi:hypothetical protein
MRDLLRVSGLPLVLCASLASPAWSEPPERQKFAPDPESGVIDGRGSVGVFPVRREGGPPEFLDPAGLEAHLKPYDDPDTELAFPAGEWAQPASGGYLYWLQGGWRMSPYAGLFFHSDSSDVVMAPVASLVDAGRVRLPADDLNLGPDVVLELLHGGSYRTQGFLRWELLLRRSADEIGEGVLLPAGPAVGALWNRSTGRYVALSRPFTVHGRMVVAAPLAAPQGDAQLVAVIRRDKAAAEGEDPETKLALRHGGREVPPDFKVTAANKTFAYWYTLPPGRVRLRADSGRTAFESPTIELAAGAIERVDGQLAPWPALDVELDLPTGVVPEKLEVRRLPSGDMVAEQALKPKDDDHRFEKVPPALLEVVLQTPFGAFSRQVDLSSGQDGLVRLEPDLVTLRGTVYHGDEPHPARLTFTNTARATREAEAGEDGLYEVASLSPLRGVSIELPGVKAAPYLDFFAPAIEESQELDFHLSDAEIRVRVTDATTGKGVEKASVHLRNSYVIPGDPEADDEELRKDRTKGVFQSVTTDETGTAWLPPLRRGSIELTAVAKGYARMKEPLKVEIPDERVDQSFEVRIEPEGAAAALRLRLPNGAPAANAEVMLVKSLSEPSPLFNGRADAEGVVEPPAGAAGVLLAKHPAAAFLVREWQPQESQEDLEWALPAPGPPLTVLVRDSSGRSVAPQAELALWAGGRRLSGMALSWLTSRSPATDPNGTWRAANVPAGPLAILAWGIGMRQEAEAGTLDGQATEVGVPWPEVVEVRVVE